MAISTTMVPSALLSRTPKPVRLLKNYAGATGAGTNEPNPIRGLRVTWMYGKLYRFPVWSENLPLLPADKVPFCC